MRADQGVIEQLTAERVDLALLHRALKPTRLADCEDDRPHREAPPPRACAPLAAS